MTGQAYTESFVSVSTPTVIVESFASVATLTASGWAEQNLSTPIGTAPNWTQGNSTTFAANSGTVGTEYIAVNFNSVAGANTISNWLFAPTRTFNNGDIIKFYTRTISGTTYPDRLQLRFSSNGASVNAGTTNASVGDFTTLLLDINPSLTTTGYPTTWTQYTVAISGLASPTSGRLAFRYFVTNGGPTGANSNYIGIDDFEVSSGAPSGWAQQNLSTPIGTSPNWIQGNSTTFAANSGTIGTEYIAVNFNSVAGANTISNWLFSPTFTFSNGDIIKFYTRTISGTTYPDRLQLRFSSNGPSLNAGTTNASVGDFTTLLLDINPALTTTGYPTSWTQYTVAISGLASPTSGRVAFRYFVTNGGPTGANSNYIGIDDFEYIPAGTPTSPNVTASKYGEYTFIPLEQVAPMPLQTTINNIGTGPTSDAKVTVNIFQGPNFVTPIQSYTSTPATIAAGGTLSANAGTYTPTTAGNYLFQFITSCSGNTITTADTAKYAFSVVNNEYARDNGTSVQGIGAGNTASAIIGNTFKINTTTYLDSVLFFVAPRSAGLGDTVRVRISSTTAGVPSNTGYIGQSASYTITAADTTSNGAVLILDVKDLSNNRLSLTPGTYFVGIEETKSGDNYNLQCSAEIFTQNTVFANLNNGAYSPLNSLLAGFNFMPIIRPYLNSCANTSITVTSGTVCAGQSFTMVPSGATTYTYSSGTSVVAPTASTSYTVTGDNNGCINTAVSSVSVNSLPIVSVNSGAICVGQSFTMTPSGATTYTFSNGSDIVTPTANSSYTLTGTDANGCINTAVSSVAVNTLPIVSVNSGTICAGQSFTMVPTGAATYAYSNGSDVVTSSVNSSYTVTGTDANGCENTAVSALSVNSLPIISVNSGTICAGQSFTMTPSGAATYTYSNGSDVVTSSVNASYTVTGTDANGCENTAVSALSVNALPVVTAVTNNTLLCVGQTATLSVSGATTYTWSTTDNTAAVAVSPTVQTTYTVNGTDANGCSNTTTVTQDVSLCTGIVTLTNSNSSINLYPNPNNGLFTIELTSTSKVIVTNALGQIVIAETFEAGKHSLDIHNEATGVYFVKVIENNNQQIIKVVKQ
jgi:hypothetical protein